MGITLEYLKTNYNQTQELGAKTEAIMKKALDGINRIDAKASTMDIWQAYNDFRRDWVLSGFKTNDKNFNSKAVEYMDEYFRGTVSVDELKSFASNASLDNYRAFIKDFWKDAKKIKRSMKKEIRIIDRDMNVNVDLFKFFSKKFRWVKSTVKDLEGLKEIEHIGMSKGTKQTIILAAAMGVIGLGALAYRYLFKRDNNEKNNEEKKTQQNNNITATKNDVVTDSVNTTPETTVDKVIEEEIIQAAEEQKEPFVFIPPTYQYNESALPGPVSTKPASKAPETEPSEQTVEIPAKEEIADTKTIVPPEEKQTVVQSTDNKVEEVATADKQEIKISTEPTEEERRIAFEKAVAKAAETIDLEGVESEVYTIVNGDSFWRIAEKTLKKEAMIKLNLTDIKDAPKPSNNEIVKRIALIAVLNQDDEKLRQLGVTKYPVRTGNTLKVPSQAMLSYIESNPVYCQILADLAKKLV